MPFLSLFHYIKFSYKVQNAFILNFKDIFIIKKLGQEKGQYIVL
ncbi:signal peptidase II [Staphylococcus lugdunensis]|uniref:Signal peptidase II n=1 Tax=Staphylococcus lugdunensis TaxID=28035 RepID=A0A133Q3P8_STALU|nr:hypothetical protein SLGD_01600 [Staphylococcus lugdunensis HKU09-01]ARB77931.1 signal peptidase II [Staphylococcus lugdunensis]EFU85069.1 hypothetical protein HMPREF0790_0501 [Staphylococcus lugdunensis M23590]ARJ09451.1 signal peptidase II [Staphylococcus lugdunensis]ARJ11636.1 signal peptidase II [Staphylococcus lugdunensis]